MYSANEKCTLPRGSLPQRGCIYQKELCIMEKAIVLSVMSAVFVFIAVLDTVNKIREKNNSGDN